MGVPSELGCSDYARRALVALDFPYSEGGGNSPLCTRYRKKGIIYETGTHMQTMGIFWQFLEKSIWTKEG